MVEIQKVVFVALATFFCCERIAADRSLQLLENRAAYYGGFPLSIDLGGNCPAGTYSCDSEQLGSCCPTNNFCANAGTICCPTADDCSVALINAPTCAEPSWTFWVVSATYTCCLPGNIPDNNGGCTTPSNSAAASTALYQTETQSNLAKPTGDNTVITGSVSTTAASSATASVNTAGPTGYYGGFSLYLDLETVCPSGSFSCNYWNVSSSEQAGPCCPVHTFCSNDGQICCPSPEDCSQTVGLDPTCADPSWALLSDANIDYTCCLPGMSSDNSGYCVAAGNPSAVTYHTTETQGNTAEPTGDGTATPITNGVGTTAIASTAGGAAATEANSPPGSATGGTATSSKKNSAYKALTSSKGLVLLIIFKCLLL